LGTERARDTLNGLRDATHVASWMTMVADISIDINPCGSAI
jgi:hypothetical protein